MSVILVLNAGSSSLKFAGFAVGRDGPVPMCHGQVEGLGAAPRFTARMADGSAPDERRWTTRMDHAAALGEIIPWLEGALAGRAVIAVGHRVVHGGADFAAPLRITPGALEALRGLIPLAPLHQPHNLAGIEAAARHFPNVPQLACFDTAFHRTQPEVAERFALPERFFAQGIRRYGFHGLSYEYIARRLALEDAALAAGRLVVAHLGNGASLCAIAGGRSQGSSMGLTALDGVPMGTRCGQLDPGVVLHMLDTLGMTTAEVTHLLYHDSGLKGLSGVSQDVREIEAANTPAAALALDHFAHRVRREVAALAAGMGGLEALVFTAGIGENAAGLRARICAGLEFMGITLDAAANAGHQPRISRPGAAVQVLVRRTDEEAMIAQHVLEVLAIRTGAGTPTAPHGVMP